MFWFVIRIDDILFPSITCYEADKLRSELFFGAELSLKKLSQANKSISRKHFFFLENISKTKFPLKSKFIEFGIDFVWSRKLNAIPLNVC